MPARTPARPPSPASPPASPARPRGRPRTKPGEERRRDLLDAGLAAFTRQGVAAASLDEIVRAAGVAKGTFYLYFRSKDDLLLALQRDFERTLVSRADDAVAAAGEDWTARADAWVGAVLEDYPSGRALHDVLFHHPVGPAPEPQVDDEPHRDLVAALADLVTAGTAAGAYRVDDAELTAVLLCGALHRAFDRIWHRPELDDADRLLAAARRLFRRALALPDPTP